MADIWTYIKSITETKKNIWDEESEGAYNIWTTNRALSQYPDTIMYAQEANLYNLPKKLHYDFLINNTIRPGKRYAKWAKKQSDSDIDAVSEYYGYNIEKAKTALTLLSSEQLEVIKKRLEKGG